MSNENNTLLHELRDLQLRVTKFSAIEQQLINTRDKLDQELELYKRLQFYSSKSLDIVSETALLNLIPEAIIDILEVECSILLYKHLGNPALSRLLIEGCAIQVPEQTIATDIGNISIFSLQNNTKILPAQQLANFSSFFNFNQVLIHQTIEHNLEYELYFIVGISIQNKDLYNTIEERHWNILSIFAHNIQSVLANLIKNRKIELQFQQISRSENELRKLSLIATKTKSGVLITDTFGKVEWVNDAFTKISGYTLEEVSGLKPKDFLQGVQTPKEDKIALSNALKKKEDIELVILNKTKEGNNYYNQVEIISVFDDKGKHINFIGIQKDITDEINFKKEILSINSRFKLISDFSKIGIWDWDFMSDKISWNKPLSEISGLPFIADKSTVLQLWSSIIYPEDKERIIEEFFSFKKSSNNHCKQEYRIVRDTDKSVRQLESMMIAEYNEAGKMTRLIGSIQDVTSLKLLQSNLENAVKERDISLQRINALKSFYESILKYSPSEIFVFDQNLQLNFTNINSNESNSNWNFPPNTSLYDLQLKQNNLSDIIYRIQEAIQENKMVQLEDSYLDKNGEQVFMLRSIMPYFNEIEKMEHIIVIGINITELKQIQKDVLQKNEELSKINLELDNFVYSISHDLRSPLLSIKGLASLVLHTKDLTAENRKFIDMILTSASRLDNTIQEILEYSRNSRVEVSTSEFDLTEMIQTIFDDLKFSTECATQLFIASNKPTIIQSDKSRINVLLRNIIGNSIKYSRKSNPSWIKININSTDEEYTISIQDNGEGIAPKHLDRVFEMFYRATTNSVGTGLGLYICNEIIKKLGGTISIESEIGVGTTIAFQIPNLNLS
ncbi:MAG: PAS domain-containing sensor histidine kinase [Ferruginibacter sp.]